MKTAKREKQMTQKQPSKASKTQKAAFSKNIKKTMSCFNVFDNKGLSRKPQEAEEGSQKAPKKSKIPKNRNPKLSPKIRKYWEPILEPTLKPKHSQNQPEKNSILRPPSPASQGSK